MRTYVKAVFIILSFCFISLAKAGETIVFKSLIGDKIVEHSLDSEKTKSDQFKYFSKKAKTLLKFKSHDSKFCVRDYLELTVTNKEKKEKVFACVRSKTKLTKQMKNLANLLEVQYGNPK